MSIIMRKIMYVMDYFIIFANRSVNSKITRNLLALAKELTIIFINKEPFFIFLSLACEYRMMNVNLPIFSSFR